MTNRKRQLFDWRDAFCSADGPPPTTRLVLWTVSKHMDADGAGAWPSQATIAEESGLKLSAVKLHLRIAEELGWLRRTPRQRGSRKSFRYGTFYVATIPASKRQIGSRSDPNLGHVADQGRSPRDCDLGRHVATSSSGSSSRTTPSTSPGKESSKNADKESASNPADAVAAMAQAPSKTAVQRVRERVAGAPKRYSNGELLHDWPFAVELTREGTTFTPKEAGAHLGRMRKQWDWPPVRLAILEAAKQGLYGHAAMTFLEERFR